MIDQRNTKFPDIRLRNLYEKLLRNGQKQDEVRGTEQEIDFPPVVKLFTPDAACTWLLTEIESGNPDIGFGLCDLGFQCPELGSVYLPEIRELRGKLGLPVERDRHFQAAHPLSIYTRAARTAGGITENPQALAQAAAAEIQEAQQ